MNTTATILKAHVALNAKQFGRILSNIDTFSWSFTRAIHHFNGQHRFACTTNNEIRVKVYNSIPFVHFFFSHVAATAPAALHFKHVFNNKQTQRMLTQIQTFRSTLSLSGSLDFVTFGRGTDEKRGKITCFRSI